LIAQRIDIYNYCFNSPYFLFPLPLHNDPSERK
jgi:hypothetical protein